MDSEKEKVRVTALLVCAVYAGIVLLLFTTGAYAWSEKIIVMGGLAGILAVPVCFFALEFKDETGVNAFSLLFDTGQRKHKSREKKSITILESR